MEAKKEGGWRLRRVIITAIISGALVELGLLSPGAMGFNEASNQVLNEAVLGLRELTPWRLAIGRGDVVRIWAYQKGGQCKTLVG